MQATNPVSALYVPNGQLVHEVCPLAEIVPAAHFVHAVRADAAPYVPAWQFLQAVAPVYLPGAQVNRDLISFLERGVI